MCPQFSLSFFLQEQKCWSENGQLQSPFPYLTSCGNTDVAQKGFVLFQDLSTAWEAMGWKRCDLRSGADCMGLASAPLGVRVLPHALFRVTTKGATQRWLLRRVHAVLSWPFVLICRKCLHCLSETLVSLKDRSNEVKSLCFLTIPS